MQLVCYEYPWPLAPDCKERCFEISLPPVALHLHSLCLTLATLITVKKESGQAVMEGESGKRAMQPLKGFTRLTK